MIGRSIFFIALLFSPAAAAIRIVSIEPTVLFPRATPLRQIALVTLFSDEARPVSCELSAGGGPAAKVAVPPGVSRHQALVADIDSPQQVEFHLRAAGGAEVLASRAETWQPQRKWKIHIVKSSHEDLGYENYIFNKQHDIANNIDVARDMSQSRENLSDLERVSESKFHYTMETLLFQRNYIEERGEAAWRRIVEHDLKTGNMFLMGAPSGVHSHWMDYEELARMAYPARRETKDRFGLDLKTFMIVDNPSLSWSGAQVLAEAGFRYVARWGQGWRTGGNNDYRHTKLPALFWWQAPDGVHRILFGWRSHYGLSLWYGQTGGGYGNLIDVAATDLSSRLKEIESGTALGPYPYDALVHPEYVDHDNPRFDGRVLPAWNLKYAYPEIQISSPQRFFEYVEKTYGPTLPVLSGDLNNFSADYATIDPESQGWIRRASRLLPVAEGLGALAMQSNPGYLLSPSFVARTWTRLFDYSEHSWPTQPPASDVQLFNAAWVKKEEGRRALGAAESAYAEASTEFAKLIRSGPGQTIAVFNSLAHARSGLVQAQGSFEALTDLATGRPVVCQKTAEGVEFLASDVPAFGYKLFRVEPGTASQASPFEVGADSIANEFYAVRFDRTTGAVRSIVEKSTGRELIDAKAPYLANQMIYVHRNERESREGFEHSPTKARRMEGVKGPVRAEFTVWIDDDKTQAAIRQTVVLYAGLKRIDFVNRLEHARVLFSKNYEDRYKDNIFYAFPFAVAAGQGRAEYAGGVVRPNLDQLGWGSQDYLSANRWVDVSNAEHGVTLVPWNEAIFHFGEIRYNRFATEYKPSSPWLFSYAWSNRMAGLLTLNGDDCNAEFGYSLTSHGGDWDSGETTRFAWSTASPLTAIPLLANSSGTLSGNSRSFLAIDAPNVELTVLKPSEQPGRGWIARFVETHGKKTEFTLDASSLQVEQARECDLVENEGSALAVNGGRVRVSILPFGHATVSLRRGLAPGVITGFRAKAVGDQGAWLAWQAVTGSAAYNVYRSEDPDAPPSTYTLVARAVKPAFEDRGLHIKTRYFYRVAAVSAANLQGEPSARVEVEPDGPNIEPPAPVDELGVVRRAPDKLMVFWRSNTDPDVARYRVYRGESAGFATEGVQPVAVMSPARYFLQLYVDTGLTPGKTYFYKVLAEDWAGNRQKVSPVASAATPRY